MSVEKHLEISTAHMPSSDPDFGVHTAMEYKYGYFVILFANLSPTPNWLLPIVKLAEELEVDVVNFESLADIHDDLPVYDW